MVGKNEDDRMDVLFARGAGEALSLEGGPPTRFPPPSLIALVLGRMASSLKLPTIRLGLTLRVATKVDGDGGMEKPVPSEGLASRR